jgi:pyrimidine-nucleoside phosphorylase
MLGDLATFAFRPLGQESLAEVARRFREQRDSGLAAYFKRNADNPDALIDLLKDFAELDLNDADAADHIARLALAIGIHDGPPPDWRSLTGRRDAVAADMPSTGGIGNKTPITVFAIVAAVAPDYVYQPKISSRGASGGTIDILESVGYDPLGEREEFVASVIRNRADLINPLREMASMDAVLWKLRQQHDLRKVTALTIASILGKKVAVGCDCVLIDVKAGPDSKLGSLKQNIDGSKLFVAVGRRLGMKVRCVVTNNYLPQGCCIGRRLSMLEIARVLRGENAPEGGNSRAFQNLRALSIELAARLLDLADIEHKGLSHWYERCNSAVQGGDRAQAWAKLAECMARRGVTFRDSLPVAILHPTEPLFEIPSHCDGQIGAVDPIALDQAFSLISQPEDRYYTAGILISRGPGDEVISGAALAQSTEGPPAATGLIRQAFRMEHSGAAASQQSTRNPAQSPDATVLAIVGSEGAEIAPMINLASEGSW